MYDDDVYGARILAEQPSATEEESIVCNHLIAMQTHLVDMQWSALDFSTDPPAQRTFKIEFEEDEVKAEFKDIFDEGRKPPSIYLFASNITRNLQEKTSPSRVRFWRQSGTSTLTASTTARGLTGRRPSQSYQRVNT